MTPGVLTGHRRGPRFVGASISGGAPLGAIRARRRRLWRRWRAAHREACEFMFHLAAEDDAFGIGRPESWRGGSRRFVRYPPRRLDEAAGTRSSHGGASQWLKGNLQRRARSSPPREPPATRPRDSRTRNEPR